MKMPWTKAIEDAYEFYDSKFEGVWRELVKRPTLDCLDEKIAKVDKKCLELAELLLGVTMALDDLSRRVPEKSPAPKKKKK